MAVMRAMVLDRIRGPLAVREVPDPVPPPGGVVVRVLATGLCRSDWHAWAGHDEISLPHVPGHELAGVVVATGSGVSRWSDGDRVTVPFVEGCGRCGWCRSGNAQVCPDQQQPGFTHWGSFAQYVALHAADTNLVAVPDGVTAEAAASLGCRFPPVEGHPRVPMARVIGWELDLFGTHGMAAADYPAMLSLIERGDLRPQ